MLSIRKFNPMVRAIGTMGVVAGLVGAVTFAAQPSNVVTLENNSASTTTASLAIVDGDSCSGTTIDTVATGFTVSKLSPGETSSPFAFCLANTGTTALDVTVSSTDSLSGDPATSMTLNVNCGQGTASVGLNNLGTPTFVGTIPATSGDACTATVTLAPGYNGAGGTTPLFNLNFAGTSSPNQTTSTTT